TVVAAAVLTMADGRVVQSAEQSETPWRAIQENTSRSFVLVSYHLKKSSQPLITNGQRGSSGTTLQRILNKNAIDVVGLIVSDTGVVFSFEPRSIEPNSIARITLRGADGVVVPARPDRLLIKAPGTILRLEGTLPAGWRALQFAEIADVTADTPLYAATMTGGKYYHIFIEPCLYGCAWDNSAWCGACLETPEVSGASVLCDERGTPVGVTGRDHIDLGPTGPAWRGKDILADAGIPCEQQKQLERQIRKDFAAVLYEIRITPRPQPQEDDEYGLSYDFWYLDWQSEESTPEVVMYGLGFAEDKLLIPQALPKEMVAGIDTITVMVDGNDVPGRFRGVLTQCGATVIELPDGKLPRILSVPADGKLPRTEPFWAVFAREMAGLDLRIECTRWIDKEQGYGDLWYPSPEQPLLMGSWLLDSQGRLAGLFTEARRDREQLDKHLLASESVGSEMLQSDFSTPVRRSAGPGWQDGYSTDARLFETCELAKIVADLPAHCDPCIRHLNKDQQRRRAWLGVEYTAPDKEMAKHMNIREPTQDGRIGLVVNRVYEGSPAAKMGLVEGDVLLTIAVPGAAWPIELIYDDEEFDMSEFDEADIPEEFKDMGYEMPRARPWPSQDNTLTRLLDDIGVGTTVTLRYVHETKILEKDFAIQQAPRDMLSAARYKNEMLGLTVKDVTYEVRAALRLEPNEPAVVVTKIEPGTPAALARINTYELIRAIDGTPVDNVATFEKLIKEARRAKKESVRVTVEWMGETRLADLKFEAKNSGLLKSLLKGN
ncbi:MAG: PDZ domain-containing protein, partial [Solirubrobacterales bacterium]